MSECFYFKRKGVESWAAVSGAEAVWNYSTDDNWESILSEQVEPGEPGFLLQDGGENGAGDFEVPGSGGRFGVVALNVEPGAIFRLADDVATVLKLQQVYVENLFTVVLAGDHKSLTDR